MRLMAAGLDQRESALETRERFAFTASAAEDFMREMKGRGVESVLLSTCNRTELFVFADEDPRGILREARGDADFFFFEGAGAVRHVFEVAAGLRSQIPVEDQILGQMKNALAAARVFLSTRMMASGGRTVYRARGACEVPGASTWCGDNRCVRLYSNCRSCAQTGRFVRQWEQWFAWLGAELDRRACEWEAGCQWRIFRRSSSRWARSRRRWRR